MFRAWLLLISVAAAKQLLFSPLDERFTTRVAFLNLAAATPAEVISQPEQLLPFRKRRPDPDAVVSWFSGALAAQEDAGAVISLEMLLYGGLIASRTCNDSTAEVASRVAELLAARSRAPRAKLYASAVVMRIPAYNGDFEEPWYWADYGRDLYEYSFFTDKFSKTHSQEDAQQADAARAKVPSAIVEEFVWRRQRNFNITVGLLEALQKSLSEGPPLFEQLYVTLDDNAEYGFNIAEAARLRQLVTELGLESRVLIYPGADEVPLALLSRFWADGLGAKPRMALVYRAPNATERIPNFEGQPMVKTLLNQIEAAGARPVASGEPAEVTLLVNNFETEHQLEAPQQSFDPPPGGWDVEYRMFDDFLQNSSILGFADNRFSNGADVGFVHYMLKQAPRFNVSVLRLAYAGWNTNGNTLGTVIANSVLVALFGSRAPPPLRSGKSCERCSPCQQGDFACAHSYFNVLRVVEDRDWQAVLRQTMNDYIQHVPTDSVNTLGADLAFYERFAFKALSDSAAQVAPSLQVQLQLAESYFPWNRTFEIGLVGALGPPGKVTELLV